MVNQYLCQSRLCVCVDGLVYLITNWTSITDTSTVTQSTNTPSPGQGRTLFWKIEISCCVPKISCEGEKSTKSQSKTEKSEHQDEKKQNREWPKNAEHKAKESWISKARQNMKNTCWWHDIPKQAKLQRRANKCPRRMGWPLPWHKSPTVVGVKPVVPEG